MPVALRGRRKQGRMDCFSVVQMGKDLVICPGSHRESVAEMVTEQNTSRAKTVS